MQSPLVSIIVPVYQGEKFIRSCLDALMGQTGVQGLVEIIVVNNASTDCTAKILEAYPVCVVHEEICGSYKARNRGVKESHGEFIVFTDHDVIASDNWVETIIAAFEKHPEWAAVQGRSLGINYNSVAEAVQKVYDQNLFNDIVRSNGTCIRLDTRNCAIRRTLFDQIGLFNEQLRFWGDAEFGGRLVEHGFTIGFVSEMHIFHINPTEIDKIIDVRIREGWWTSESFRPLGRRFTLRTFPKAAMLHMHYEHPEELLQMRFNETRTLHYHLLTLSGQQDILNLTEGIAKLNRIAWELGVLQHKVGQQPCYCLE